MHRSFLPFFLASLSFTLAALAINMPLFEWQISEVVTDFPSEVHVSPSPWITKLGDSLVGGSYTVNDESYIFHKVYVSKEQYSCSPERLNSIVGRSGNDEAIEQITLNINQRIIPWLSQWNIFAFLLLLCGINVWWFTIRYKRSIFEALILTVLAVIIFVFLINVWLVLFHKVGIAGCPGLYGTVTFNAILSKIHYETLLVLFASIGAEAGAFGTLLYQIIKTVPNSDQRSKI